MNEVVLLCTQSAELYSVCGHLIVKCSYGCVRKSLVDVCTVGSTWHDRGMRWPWPTPALSTRPNVPRDSR